MADNINRIKPTKDRVVLEVLNLKEYGGKVILPSTAKNRLFICEILAMGEDAVKEGLYEVGDKVIVSFYTGIPIQLYDVDIGLEERYKLTTTDEIIAKWE